MTEREFPGKTLLRIIFVILWVAGGAWLGWAIGSFGMPPEGLPPELERTRWILVAVFAVLGFCLGLFVDWLLAMGDEGRRTSAEMGTVLGAFLEILAEAGTCCFFL